MIDKAAALALTAVLVLCPVAGGQVATNLPVAPAGAQERIPSSWFNKAKGYEKALALQKTTGADIFIYFTRQAPDDEAGLCQWFQTKGLTASALKKYLDHYIKVEVPLPSNPDCQKLAESFEVRKCPAVFIVQPNGRKSYCSVFDWSGGRPKLYPPEDLVELLRARSSEKYNFIPSGKPDKH